MTDDRADRVERFRALWERTIPPSADWNSLPPGATYKPDEDETGGDDRERGSGFKLLEEVARGGVGVVHRARQSDLDRIVAVKRIDPFRVDAAARRAFVTEALVTARLEHPNIVPVHALGTDDAGNVFLAMKLVRGATWRDLLHPTTTAQRTFAKGYDLDRHLDVLEAVCNAVAFAHSRGIVHRDLKPANVMVGEFGEVLVMDWGLAVASEPLPGLEAVPLAADVVKPSGTPAYMAPELARGLGRFIGPVTDVYLLGALLHEVLTGRPPHEGDELIQVILAAAESAPPELPPDTPEDLAAICRKAMSRKPSRRYQTAAEFLSALTEFRRHRESRVIERDARAVLSRVTESADRDDVGTDTLYATLAESVAGFRQAVSLWPGNDSAVTGLAEAREWLAAYAIEAGDVGLAETHLSALRTAGRELPELERELERAIARRERTEQAAAERSEARVRTRSLQKRVTLAAIAVAIAVTLGVMSFQRERAAMRDAITVAQAGADRRVEGVQQALSEAREGRRLALDAQRVMSLELATARQERDAARSATRERDAGVPVKAAEVASPGAAVVPVDGAEDVRQRLRAAQSRGLVEAARRRVRSDATLALALAREAVRRDRSPGTLSGLLAVLASPRVLRSVASPSVPVTMLPRDLHGRGVVLVAPSGGGLGDVLPGHLLHRRITVAAPNEAVWLPSSQDARLVVRTPPRLYRADGSHLEFPEASAAVLGADRESLLVTVNEQVRLLDLDGQSIGSWETPRPLWGGEFDAGHRHHAAGTIAWLTQTDDLVLWRPGEGRPRKIPSVEAFWLSPAGDRVIIRRSSKPLLLDVEGKQVAELDAFGRFTHDGSSLVLRSGRLVDSNGVDLPGSPIMTPPTQGASLGLTLSRDGRTVALWDFAFGHVSVIDLSFARAVTHLRFDGSRVSDVAVAPNGALIAACGEGGLSLWTREGIRVVRLQSSIKIRRVEFVGDGDWLVAEDEQGTLRFWELGSVGMTVARGVGGGRFAASSSEHVAVETSSEEWLLVPTVGGPTVRLAAGGEPLLLAGFDAETSRWWGVRKSGGAIAWDPRGTMVAEFDTPPVTAAAWREGSSAPLVLLAGADLRAFEASGREVSSVPAPENAVDLVGGHGEMVLVRVHETGRWKKSVWVSLRDGSARTLEHPGGVSIVGTLGSDATAFTAAGDAVRFWSSSGEQVARVMEPYSNLVAAAVSRAGDLVATLLQDNAITEQVVRLRRIDGTEVWTLPPLSSDLLFLAFSGDGRRLLVRDVSGRVTSWPTDPEEIEAWAGRVSSRTLTVSERRALGPLFPDEE